VPPLVLVLVLVTGREIDC